eukprot:1158554-Pelagomonas_calceolata.AAC.9
MRRKLDSRLYLLVNQQLQALPSSQWQFPFAQHQGDEPIRCGGLGCACARHCGTEELWSKPLSSYWAKEHASCQQALGLRCVCIMMHAKWMKCTLPPSCHPLLLALNLKRLGLKCPYRSSRTGKKKGKERKGDASPKKEAVCRQSKHVNGQSRAHSGRDTQCTSSATRRWHTYPCNILMGQKKLLGYVMLLLTGMMRYFDEVAAGS